MGPAPHNVMNIMQSFLWNQDPLYYVLIKILGNQHCLHSLLFNITNAIFLAVPSSVSGTAESQQNCHNALCGMVHWQLGILLNSKKVLYSSRRSSALIVPFSDSNDGIFPFWVKSSVRVCAFLSSMNREFFWRRTSMCPVHCHQHRRLLAPSH